MIRSDQTQRGHTILIADCELPVRMGLCAILAREAGLLVPSPVSTISELTAMVRKHQTALIMMGLRFPDGDGIDACRTLLSKHERLRALFFANHATPQTVMRAVDAGATGILLKTVARTELLAGIRQVLAGQSAFDPILMSETLEWIRAQHPSNDAPVPHLSPRHQQILPLLSEGLTNKEISTHLNLSEKTVKHYLADLFDRLRMSRRAQVAAWFIGHTVRHLPSHETSITASKIWGHTRPHALRQEEPLHAHYSPY